MGLTKVELVQKESKTLTFTCKDSDGDVVDVSTAECSLYCKRHLDDSTYLFTKSSSDFNVSNGTNGIVTVNVSSTDLDFDGDAYCILKIVISSGNVDKTVFRFHLQESDE